MEVLSLSSESQDFHCSWVRDTSVAPGKNTSFNVIYLGYNVGPTESKIEVTTSHGVFDYLVHATGNSNNLEVLPLVQGRVPVGESYVQPLVLYNSYDSPLVISEIYSSSPTLQLDLSTLHDDDGPTHSSLWQIDPFQRKSVMALSVTHNETERVRGYINVRSSATTGVASNLVIPVDVMFSSSNKSLNSQLSDTPQLLGSTLLVNMWTLAPSRS